MTEKEIKALSKFGPAVYFSDLPDFVKKEIEEIREYFNGRIFYDPVTHKTLLYEAEIVVLPVPWKEVIF